LKGLGFVSLNLSRHNYNFAIIGVNETSVIAEFASLDHPGHKEWKMFSGEAGSPLVGRGVGCCVRTGVSTKEKCGWGNFMEVEDFRAGMIYPAIDKSYKNIFGPKSAVLFSHPTRVFCRGPP